MTQWKDSQNLDGRGQPYLVWAIEVQVLSEISEVMTNMNLLGKGGDLLEKSK